MTRKLGERIVAFISKYAGIRPDYDAEYDDIEDSFSSPDASMLHIAGILLKKGQTLSFVVHSEWGSGGYHPYSSEEGRKEHDEIMKELRSLVDPLLIHLSQATQAETLVEELKDTCDIEMTQEAYHWKVSFSGEGASAARELMLEELVK